jgi:hypothetical protein
MVRPASMFSTQLPHRHASHKSITDNIAFHMGYSIGGSCRRSAIPGPTAYDNAQEIRRDADGDNPRGRGVMKLRMVEVSNFRSIDKSNEFSVGETTCLVGKDESGKTTLLQALECLHPYEATRNKYNKLRDYPRRHYADYAARHPSPREARHTRHY